MFSFKFIGRNHAQWALDKETSSTPHVKSFTWKYISKTGSFLKGSSMVYSYTIYLQTMHPCSVADIGDMLRILKEHMMLHPAWQKNHPGIHEILI